MSTIGSILESHVNQGKKLTIRKVSVDWNEPDETENIPKSEYVFIEGDGDSLRFLGRLLIAFAEGDLGCTFDIHPQGAGNAHFSSTSDIGIKLHKTPCQFD